MKSPSRRIWILLAAFAVLPAIASNSFHSPKAELQPIPKISLKPQPPLSSSDAAKISGLIKDLASIKDPDYGLSGTLTGEAFAPIPSATQVGAILFTPAHIHQSDTLAELVKLGPKALPYLLAALDDATPTKLTIKHNFTIGGMWFEDESGPNGDMPSYTVKVGDVCLVIIGEITGFPYHAVEYQPTACTIINSPVHDTNLLAKIRDFWSDPNPAQHLLDSLLRAYANHNDEYSRQQAGAAMRLLYYFPNETTHLIAMRLHGLDVRKSEKARDAANGVSADEFIKAVAWSREPAIRAELRRIFKTTTDLYILTATAGPMEAADMADFQKRLEQFMANLPDTEEGPYGESYALLITLGQQFGDKARPAYERYMEHASLQKRRSMCRVLEEVHGDWSVDLLGPLLADTRPAEGWTYAVNPGRSEPRLPIRICDEAADTISKNFPKLKFIMAGQHADLDQQIKKMRDQIARHDY